MIRTVSSQALPPLDGQICTVVGVDINGFTRPDRDDDIRRFLHQALYGMVRSALRQADIPWDACFHEDRGDGILIVIPPGITARGVIHPFLSILRKLIRLHNHACQPAARIQLRVAAHIGPVDLDDEGFVGSTVNHMARMLDARRLKRSLGTSTAELAFIASEYLYTNVICPYPTLLSPADFQAIRFQVKYTRAKAWIYAPGLQQLMADGWAAASVRIAA